MNRVGIFIRSLLRGGAEKQAILLHHYLSEFFITYLIVYDNESQDIHVISDNGTIQYLDGSLIKKGFQLYNFLKKKNITHLFNFLPVNNILGLIIGKIAGVKYLYGGIRGSGYKSKSKMILMKFLCNNISTAFISNSYAAKTSYTDYGFYGNKIKVIHNAIEEVELMRIDHSKIIILSIGRFTIEKDYHTAIDSINYLVQKYPEIRSQITYNIIGYGKLESTIIKKIKASKLIDICIVITNGDIGDSYYSCDILLSTSISEGMPNVVMEAMNNGLPVVATDVGDTKYLVNDQVNGYLCKPGDAETIAEKLYSLIVDEKLRLKMGSNSREIINNNFRPEKVFISYESLINGSKK